MGTGTLLLLLLLLLLPIHYDRRPIVRQPEYDEASTMSRTGMSLPNVYIQLNSPRDHGCTPSCFVQKGVTTEQDDNNHVGFEMCVDCNFT